MYQWWRPSTTTMVARYGVKWWEVSSRDSLRGQNDHNRYHSDRALQRLLVSSSLLNRVELRSVPMRRRIQLLLQSSSYNSKNRKLWSYCSWAHYQGLNKDKKYYRYSFEYPYFILLLMYFIKCPKVEVDMYHGRSTHEVSSPRLVSRYGTMIVPELAVQLF